MWLRSPRPRAPLGGALLTSFGDDACCVRTQGRGDGHHLLGRRHFKIERPLRPCPEPCDIVVADVATILAQMRGDAVSPRRHRDLRGLQGIGMPATARVADGGDVIDVDAQAEFWMHGHDRGEPNGRPAGKARLILPRVAKRSGGGGPPKAVEGAGSVNPVLMLCVSRSRTEDCKIATTSLAPPPPCSGTPQNRSAILWGPRLAWSPLPRKDAEEDKRTRIIRVSRDHHLAKSTVSRR